MPFKILPWLADNASVLEFEFRLSITVIDEPDPEPSPPELYPKPYADISLSPTKVNRQWTAFSVLL